VQLNSLRLESGKSELTNHISHLEEQLRKHRLHVEQFHSDSTAVRQMKAQVFHRFVKRHYILNFIWISSLNFGACGSVVVKALRYKPEGRGFDTQRGDF
jgi:hypothetical protein